MDEHPDTHALSARGAQTVNTKPGFGQTRDCLDAWYQPFVHTNGDVWPCCWFYGSLGNMYEEPFDRIINGSAFQDLRRELLTGNLREACANCPSRSLTTPELLLQRLRAQKPAARP
jgi:radical SAM protein with 4Fe4S-binding SPASM domain